MRTYLLDTNVFVFLTFKSKVVPEAVRGRLQRGRMYVSLVCVIELAIKHSIGRFPVPDDFGNLATGVAGLVDDLGAQLLPIQLSHLDALARLPLHHRDPFDRLVISQALAEDMTLVSSDGAFAAYADLDLLRI